VLGGVVIILLLIYAVVVEAKSTKRNEVQSQANVSSMRLNHITPAALGQHPDIK